MKMITHANRKSKGFYLSISLALFLCLICAPSFAADNASAGVSTSEQQTSQITGKIIDTQGQPVPAVSITVKGTNTATYSGSDGTFSLNAPANATLEVESFTHDNTEVNIGNRTSGIEITVAPKALEKEQVVVTGFGTGQRKQTLTGAISSVNADEIAVSASATTSGALVGKIAGLNFRQTNGKPGHSTKIQIRNFGTPLFVVDGLPVDEGVFNNLDFNDIENIVLLKDASAAIYGVRAANGVMLVTTKSGKRGAKNTVQIQGYYGWQSMNQYFPDAASAPDYIRAKVQSDVLQGNNPSFSKDEYQKWVDKVDIAHTGFDWKDYIFINAPQNYVQGSVQGGTDMANYYVSIGHLNQEMAFRNFGGFYRTNVQMNLDIQVNKRLKIGTRFSGRIEKRMNPGIPGDDTWLPRFGVFKNLPTKRPYANENPKYPALTSSDPDTNFATLTFERAGRATDTWRGGTLTMDAEYLIAEGLKVTVLGQYIYSDQMNSNHERTFDVYQYTPNADPTLEGEYTVARSMANPYRYLQFQKIMEYNSQARLNFDRTFGNHGISAVVGVETNSRDNPDFVMRAYPTFNSMEKIYWPEVKQLDGAEFKHELNRTSRRVGFVGSVNYNYAQKYLLGVVARYDGSYLFDKDHRWGLFPAVSAGWRISEENFWKSGSISNIISDMKIRASYGMTGDDGDISAYAFMGGYDYNARGMSFDGSTYTIGSAARGVPSVLTWRKAKTFDIGIDFGLLNNRLMGSLDYFDRHLTGMRGTRGDVLIPTEVGWTLPEENLQSNRHRGMDGSLTWSSNIGEFSYSVGGNFTYSRWIDWDRYKEADSRNGQWDDYRWSVRHRYGYLNWGLKTDGQFQSWEEIANYGIDNDRNGNNLMRPGDIKYRDLNGDKVITGMDERPIGYRESDTPPLLNYGFNIGAAWKGIDFALTLSGGSGNSLLQEHEIRRPFTNDGNIATFLANDQWHLADAWDPNSELIPGYFPTSIQGTQDQPRYWKSEFWLKNVSYMKIRNIELGYSLPRRWVDGVGIQQVRVYVMAQNLLQFDNLGPIQVDPETQGGNGLDYPTPRVINIGFNLKF